MSEIKLWNYIKKKVIIALLHDRGEWIFFNDSYLFSDSGMYLSNDSYFKAAVACLAISSYMSCNSLNYYYVPFSGSASSGWLFYEWPVSVSENCVIFWQAEHVQSVSLFLPVQVASLFCFQTLWYLPLYYLWGYYLCFNSHWYSWALWEMF